VEAGVMRQTAGERREAVLTAALHEFAAKGLHGASTDDIAKAAGISQPYLFRLFGTKKELYLATARETTDALYSAFERASRGKQGEEALAAMRDAYSLVLHDRDRVMLQLKCWSTCDDPDLREQARATWRDLVELVEQRSGLDPDVVAGFFSNGVMLTILTGLDAFTEPAPWADRLVAGCRENLGKSPSAS
jgi:AcrR family transcriptional regulator